MQNTNTRRAAYRLAQDMVTESSRVRWTDEERAVLLEALVIDQRERKVPLEQWGVGYFDLMKAQMAYLSEGRWRQNLPGDEVEKFNVLVRDAGEKELRATVLSVHAQFMSEKGMAPLQYIEQLEAQLEQRTTSMASLEQDLQAKAQALDKITAENQELSNRLIGQIGELDAARARIAALESKLSTTAASVEAVANEDVPPLPMFIATSKLVQQHVKQINTANKDVIFLSNKDSMADVKRKATGRVVVLVEGHLTTELARAARNAAKEVISVTHGAGSMIIQKVQERMLQHGQTRH